GFTGGYGPVEYRTIFPTRTIPFLLSGKPIFAHAPPTSFLSDFLRQNKCALLVDQPEPELVHAELLRLAADPNLQCQLVAAAQVTARQFHGPRVAAQLKELLGATQV
ncbi:MAG: hypothetical protein D6772_13980, partial [Bacteroidetes bacterium]